MIPDPNSVAYEYKLACDGHDLYRKHFGRSILNPIAVEYVKKHCIVSGFLDVEALARTFVKNRQQKEPTHPFPLPLRDKYEIGYFVTSPDNCFLTDYVLFNKEQLEFWHDAGNSLWGLEFLTCVSRGWDGKINNFGFRLLDPSKVHNAFKWLFPMGQSATFGAHLSSPAKKLLIVEGAFDAYAFLESGVPDVIGLGAVRLTAGHRKNLGSSAIRNATICQDMDPFGMKCRESKRKTCFYSPDGKDPFDAYLKHGYVKPLYIEGAINENSSNSGKTYTSM